MCFKSRTNLYLDAYLPIETCKYPFLSYQLYTLEIKLGCLWISRYLNLSVLVINEETVIIKLSLKFACLKYTALGLMSEKKVAKNRK